MNLENPLPSGAARHELAAYIGEIVMQNVCSVTRARELEAENEHLRKLVTEERQKAQHWEGEALKHHERAGQLQDQLSVTEAALERLRPTPAPKTKRRK